MATPILGKDAVIAFQRGDLMLPYFCATDLAIDFGMETKPTKTVGDGVWKRKRGQSLDYKISLSGVLMLFETAITAFDLLDYYTNMTDIFYRIVFSDTEGGLKVIEGYVLPTNLNLGGGSEGHATGSITLEGNGLPDIRDSIELCNAVIEAAHYFKAGVVHHVSVDSLTDDSPTITRYDYQVDGGGVESVFTPGTLPWSWAISVPGIVGSSHSVTITPICENGHPGSTYTVNFTKL